MEETDSKIVYPEFKYFKSLYTLFNKAESLLVASKGGRVLFQLLGYDDSDFSRAYGEFLEVDSKLMKWILKLGKPVVMNSADIAVIGKCQKAKAKAIDENGDSFSFIFSDREPIVFKAINDEVQVESPYNCFLKHCIHLDNSFFNQEIAEVFLDDGNVNYIMGDKLLEIPPKKIIAYLKDSTNVLEYSDLNEDASRYVAIESRNKSLYLQQVFLTI